MQPRPLALLLGSLLLIAPLLLSALLLACLLISRLAALLLALRALLRLRFTLTLLSLGEQVVLCMIDLKLARLAHDPAHRDSIVDVVGYAALLPEVGA